MPHRAVVRIVIGLLGPGAALLAGARHAAGQEPDTPYPLGEVVVSADEPASEASATLRRVSTEDIEAYGARTLDEAIALLPGVYVRLGGDGVPRVDLRGFRTRQVTLLLDGVPLNATADGQFDPTLVPVEQIAEIKLTTGPGSVLYGSGGLAGVINIVTRRAGRGAEASARGEWRDGDGWLGRVTAGGGAGPVRMFGSASGASVGDGPSFGGSPTLGDPAGAPRLASDRDRLNVFGRVDVPLGTAGAAGVTVQAADGNAGVPPSVIDDPADAFATRPVYERVDDIDGLALQAAAGGPVGTGWTVRGWAYRNLLDQFSQRYADERFDPATVLTVNGTSRDRSRSVLTGGAMQIATTALPAGRATLGLTARRSVWRQELVDAVAISVPGGGGGGGGGGSGGGTGGGGGAGASTLELRSATVDRTVWEYGVALEYEVRPLPSVGLAAGGMYHRLDGSDLEDGAAGASLGAYWDAGPPVRLRATYARRFRFPTLRQLYEVSTGNPALETEEADLYEVGMEYAFLRGATISATGYRSDARNFIERPQGAPQFLNAERYRLQGIEVEAALRASSGLLARARYTYLDAEDRTPGREGTPLQYRPRHLVSTELRYTTPWRLQASGTVHYVAGQVYETRRAPLVQADLPDYALVGVRLRQPVGQLPLAVFVGADNLFDAAYEQSYGFPQAGRIVYLGLDVAGHR